jgi:hypothetical protein
MESGNSSITVSAQNLPPLLEPIPRQISAAEREQVGGVEMELGPGATIVLQNVELWQTILAVRDYLAVDHSLVGERFKCKRDRSETLSEVFAVSREETDLAVRLHAERAIAVELEFVRPSRSFGRLRHWPREHRLDGSDLPFSIFKVTT